MALVRATNLSFRYALASPNSPAALGPVTLEVEEGAFCLVTGATGCGKSTLLRSCKPELAPRGTYGGSLEVCGYPLVEAGEPTHAMDQARSAFEVGFVMQDPDAQIVCDTVWHELAFSLENLGWQQDAMRRRVAEVAHFFGIAPWVQRRTAELSAGQKQLVNLAAVLALRPRLMLLDEPTAQLDPVSRQQFLGVLGRVNRELGITVVMATHLPEEVQHLATHAIELSGLGETAPLKDLYEKRRAWDSPAPPRNHQAPTGEQATLRARDVFVRFGTDQPLVLTGLDFDAHAGRVHAVVGGNGSGKTTLLRTLAGELRPRRGKVANAFREAQVLLPQDPKALFATDSVEEELREWQASAGYSDEDVDAAKEHFGLQGLEGRHPYDVSAGQQQALALAKLVLCRPRLLLLDEPTKGLDAASCAVVVRQLRALASQGAAVVLTTHDLDVAAAVADEATLLFDGQAACTQGLPAFFEENLIWRPHGESRLYGALLRDALSRGAAEREAAQ